MRAPGVAPSIRPRLDTDWPARLPFSSLLSGDHHHGPAKTSVETLGRVRVPALRGAVVALGGRVVSGGSMRKISILTVFGKETKMCIARRAGLAITRSANGGRRWTLTHVSTGRRLGPLVDLRLREARVALSLAALLGDWTEIEFNNVPLGLHLAISTIHEMAVAR